MDIDKLAKMIKASGNTEAIEDFDRLQKGKGTLILSTLQKPGEENPGTWKELDRKKNK